MEILYLLIPLSLALSVVIVWALLWAVNHGQFDDMEGPALRILSDDDEQPPPAEDTEASDKTGKPGH